MKRTTVLLTIVVLLGPLAVRANAQTLTITKIDNTKAKQLTITGNYNLPNGTLLTIEVYVRPAGGGKGDGGYGLGAFDPKKQQGTWTAVPTNIPAGTYDVQAVMTYMLPGETRNRYYLSDTTKGVKAN